MKKILLIVLLASLSSYGQNTDYKNYATFLKKYVSNSGNVNYDKIKPNKAELDAIADQLSENRPTDKWSKNEKMAYYINIYNVYTIKSIVDNYPVKSIKDISNVWDKKIIPQGKILYSLSDIENKILRKMGDPRIHFAINCASFSCPKMDNEVYTADKLDKQLEVGAKEFINDKNKNQITTSEIKLSNIFDWYSGDFKEDSGSVIEFLNKYSKTTIDKKAKIKFLDYNWSLNK
jgi:Protein of unknown function, DUF547